MRAASSIRHRIVAVVGLGLALLTLGRGICADEDRRPNILLLLTDDQDVLLGGIDHMPRLQRHMGQQGTTFANYFVHTPICCPSRASILTGRYIHNVPIWNNSLAGNCDGAAWRAGPERDTFAVAARRAGYRTAFAGKYLNQYGRPGNDGHDAADASEAARPRVPPGWDHWTGLVGNSAYYDYRVIVSHDGGRTVTQHHHDGSYARDYLPDLVANRTRAAIRHLARRGGDRPFLVMAAWPTPHAPFTPAPRDRGRFAGTLAPRTPNWNASAARNAEKHWYMRQLPAISARAAVGIDRVHQLRQEALQSIDRHVEAFLWELQRAGVLNSTVVIYTSDNGFQLGQHRRCSDKRLLYEHDIRVPMLVRGPGVPRNATVHQPVLNIDLAPTIVELVTGSAAAPPTMDGRSFWPLLRAVDPDAVPWRSDFLVSYHGEGDPACGLMSCDPAKWDRGQVPDATNNTYHCLRSLAAAVAPGLAHSMYCQFRDDESFVEFYNLTADPWQLHNAAKELTLEQRFRLQARLAHLTTCRGDGCRDKAAVEAQPLLLEASI